MVKRIRRKIAILPKALARKAKRGSAINLEVIGEFADVIFLSQRAA